MLDSPLFQRALTIGAAASRTGPPGSDVDPAAICETLEAYAGLLAVWNRRFNLVSRAAEPDALIADALVDAAALAAVLPPDGLIVDAGAGAGLPALPLALLRPDLRLLLVEPRRRRASFLHRLGGLDWGAGQKPNPTEGEPTSGKAIPQTTRGLEWGAGRKADPVDSEPTSGTATPTAPFTAARWTVLEDRVESPDLLNERAAPDAVYTRAVWSPADAWMACERLLTPDRRLICLVGESEPRPSTAWNCQTYEELLPDPGPWVRRRIFLRRKVID